MVEAEQGWCDGVLQPGVLAPGGLEHRDRQAGALVPRCSHEAQPGAGAGQVEADEHQDQLPVRQEQVSVEKQAVVYEQVEVGKRAVQATEHVSDTIRREEAVIEKQGAVDVENGAAEGSRSARRS